MLFLSFENIFIKISIYNEYYLNLILMFLFFISSDKFRKEKKKQKNNKKSFK
jgi:hypothetical protein